MASSSARPKPPYQSTFSGLPYTTKHQVLELSNEQQEEIKECFEIFDIDKDNHIDYHELKCAAKALGFTLPKDEVVFILRKSGVSADSLNPLGFTTNNTQDIRNIHSSRLRLSQAAFNDIMAQRILARDPRDEVVRAFRLFDYDGTGKIDLEKLQRVTKELGVDVSAEEQAAMIGEFDFDGDGAIDEEGFIAICLE